MTTIRGNSIAIGSYSNLTKQGENAISLSRLNIPILAVQPSDDPLHSGNAKKNNHIDILKQNSKFVYVEPKAGSHFGFFEGENIFEAFSNKVSYTYPAKCAILFFEAIQTP